MMLCPTTDIEDREHFRRSRLLASEYESWSRIQTEQNRTVRASRNMVEIEEEHGRMSASADEEKHQFYIEIQERVSREKSFLQSVVCEQEEEKRAANIATKLREQHYESLVTTLGWNGVEMTIPLTATEDSPNRPVELFSGSQEPEIYQQQLVSSAIDLDCYDFSFADPSRNSPSPRRKTKSITQRAATSPKAVSSQLTTTSEESVRGGNSPAAGLLVEGSETIESSSELFLPWSDGLQSSEALVDSPARIYPMTTQKDKEREEEQKKDHISYKRYPGLSVLYKSARFGGNGIGEALAAALFADVPLDLGDVSSRGPEGQPVNAPCSAVQLEMTPKKQALHTDRQLVGSSRLSPSSFRSPRVKKTATATIHPNHLEPVPMKQSSGLRSKIEQLTRQSREFGYNLVSDGEATGRRSLEDEWREKIVIMEEEYALHGELVLSGEIRKESISNNISTAAPQVALNYDQSPKIAAARLKELPFTAKQHQLPPLPFLANAATPERDSTRKRLGSAPAKRNYWIGGKRQKKRTAAALLPLYDPDLAESERAGNQLLLTDNHGAVNRSVVNSLHEINKMKEEIDAEQDLELLKLSAETRPRSGGVRPKRSSAILEASLAAGRLKHERIVTIQRFLLHRQSMYRMAHFANLRLQNWLRLVVPLQQVRRRAQEIFTANEPRFTQQLLRPYWLKWVQFLEIRSAEKEVEVRQVRRLEVLGVIRMQAERELSRKSLFDWNLVARIRSNTKRARCLQIQSDLVIYRRYVRTMMIAASTRASGRHCRAKLFEEKILSQIRRKFFLRLVDALLRTKNVPTNTATTTN